MNMVKDIIMEPGRTFQEFSLLTGLTKEGCKPSDVSLETKLLDNLPLKISLIKLRMKLLDA